MYGQNIIGMSILALFSSAAHCYLKKGHSFSILVRVKDLSSDYQNYHVHHEITVKWLNKSIQRENHVSRSTCQFVSYLTEIVNMFNFAFQCMPLIFFGTHIFWSCWKKSRSSSFLFALSSQLPYQFVLMSGSARHM